MKFFNFFVIATLFAVITSCTLDKTDFEAETNRDVTEYFEFKEVTSFNSGNYKISVAALNGTFYKGYNEIRLTIINTQNNQTLNSSDVTCLPILTNSDGNKTSCPHRYNLVYNTEGNYYSGYAVFTSISNPMENWDLYIGFTDNNQLHSANGLISVQNQPNMNLNMTSFTGNDGEKYFIALVAPQKPRVAENELVAGIYKYNQPTEPAGTFPDPSQFSYSEVQNYTLKLDPRMPEPSMGNHSSPNNVDLTQKTDGLYYGVVNYTMTGNWTLNFIMQNQNGQVIKGTEVPTDFTPGIEGVKSELYIDILF
ncbi:FixH family protein [Flavobacterium cerinum]|uniref:FixH family protein n=1 Tax=Flavobacterium cerinum TaxID=2502784 RepID=A0ABY5IT27_9FLAO|nr:FixH family protein [Flavobacterium cerinum]UUC46002.1 FixH family protein [Flavobacterium cerinum]